MIDLLRSAYRAFVSTIIRPYIHAELPAWGSVYRIAVGDYTKDSRWGNAAPRWARGKLHGYDMLLDLGQWSNRATFFLGRLYDLPTQIVLRNFLKPGDTFIDIGANEGHFSLLASHLVGQTGKVIAFEPNPAPREVFRRMLERNGISNIAVRSVGLGDARATLSLKSPKVNSGEASFGKPVYADSDLDIIECQVCRGDDELSGKTPNLIKIDVEGFETFVLRGLSQTIMKSRPPIVMEMISAHLKNSGTSAEEIASIMTAHGYKPFSIGLARDGMKQRLVTTPAKISSDIADDILWLPG